MIKFVDANIFIKGLEESKIGDFVDNLNREEHCTSVLVLAETYHKLAIKGYDKAFEYIRTIMGAINVYEINSEDLFNAIKNQIKININDKIHIQVMKRSNINTIVSLDKDFDKERTITREEP